MQRPLLAIAGLFALGCLLADGLASPREIATVLALALLLLGLALASPRPLAAVVALATAGIGAGWAAAAIDTRRFEATALQGLVREADDLPVRLHGTVRGEPIRRDGRWQALLDLEAHDAPDGLRPIGGAMRLEIGGETPLPPLTDGQPLAVWSRLRAAGPEGLRTGIDAYGFCKSARLLEVGPGPSRAGALRALVWRARQAMRGAIVSAMPAGTERGLVLAMVIGDRSEIDDGTAEAFRASGTYHVLALSGAQVALVAGLVLAGLRLLVVRPTLQVPVTLALVAFYSGLVGGDVPVVRAAIMTAAVVLARAIEVDGESANLLGLAALGLLVVRPAWVGDVGFQLSFGATLGILLLTGPLLHGLPRLPLGLAAGVAASLAAQAALAPILALSFHRLAPAALLLNLLAVPASSAVLLCGLLVVLLAPLGPTAGEWAGWLAGAAARLLRFSGDLGPLTPWLDVRVPSPSLGVWACWLAGLALVYRGRRGYGLAILGLAHLTLAVGPLRPAADGRLHLIVVDVGQGDGLALVSPSGRALLVDAGGSRDRRFDPGERRIAPELWKRGVRAVDALLVTHAQWDHVGGAPFLIRAFRVGELWEGPAPLRDPDWLRVQRSLPRGPIRRSLARGMNLDWDGVRLTVLGPPPPFRPPRRIRNEDSVVLEVAFGEVRLLLTGDATGAAERDLEVGEAAVLKLAHHGAAAGTSSALLRAARPRLAIVSAGARNPFGHPRPEVLERCRRAGALVYRTDRDGTVVASTDGRRVWVRSASEPGERRLQ